MIARADIVWVDFGEPRGSEPAKVRPSVVIQDDWLLSSRLRTVLLIPLTSALPQQRFPGNVLLPAAATGLAKDSVALVTQLGPIDRDFVDPFPAGRVPPYLMAEIAAGVRLVTGI